MTEKEDRAKFIGENIRKYRKERGWTQKQLGILCNINEVQIRQYELGRANPKQETLEKIARALDIDWLQLIPHQPRQGVSNSLMKIEETKLKELQYRELDTLMQRLKKSNDLMVSHRLHEPIRIAFLNVVDSPEITFTDQELIELEKESDEFLKFKLLELAKKKIKDQDK